MNRNNCNFAGMKVITLKKLFGVVAVMMVVGVFSSILWLKCFVCSNYVSEEDYARMAQELVDQCIEK
ncbi:hypothetical protein [Sporomusa acidovorans]|nr:hypothetical protein [Sporomusa acidovorans]